MKSAVLSVLSVQGLQTIALPVVKKKKLYPCPEVNILQEQLYSDISSRTRKQRGLAAPYIEFGPMFGHLLMEHASVLCIGYLG